MDCPKGLFLDYEAYRNKTFFEASEFGGTDIVGYRCILDKLSSDFVVFPPEDKPSYLFDLMQALEKPLEFGNRKQIAALKAWAIFHATI